MPVPAPISIAVAAPPKFIVVTVVSNNPNVVAVLEMSPPLTAKSSSTFKL